MNLVLFGFKNSGKSFLAQKLALKLSCPLIETDLEIEKLSFLQTQTFSNTRFALVNQIS